MTHGHDHAPADFNRAFTAGVALNTAFVVVEVVFGLTAHSLALVADAGHNLGDVLGLLLAWGAGALAGRRPSRRRTYGLRRSSILAALINAVTLLLVTGGVLWEAARRFGRPESTSGVTVIAVACAGVAVNGATAWLFFAGRGRDLNIRAAFLHMAADAVLALGVALTGIVILLTSWRWLDPAASVAISVVILGGTWSLLRDSVNLALDAVPEGIDPRAVERYLAALPGVRGVHDLHIWAMSTTETALTAHLVIPDGAGDDLLGQACRDLHDRFEIVHSTIQVERDPSDLACRQGSPGIV